MKFYINDKKVTKAQAATHFGEAKLEKRIKEAKEDHTMDPYLELSWADGLRIEID